MADNQCLLRDAADTAGTAVPVRLMGIGVARNLFRCLPNDLLKLLCWGFSIRYEDHTIEKPSARR